MNKFIHTDTAVRAGNYIIHYLCFHIYVKAISRRQKKFENKAEKRAAGEEKEDRNVAQKHCRA